MSLVDNPTPKPAAEHVLLNEQAILREFLDTIDSDDDVSSVYNVYSNCKHPVKKERTVNVDCVVI